MATYEMAFCYCPDCKLTHNAPVAVSAELRKIASKRTDMKPALLLVCERCMVKDAGPAMRQAFEEVMGRIRVQAQAAPADTKKKKAKK